MFFVLAVPMKRNASHTQLGHASSTSRLLRLCKGIYEQIVRAFDGFVLASVSRKLLSRVAPQSVNSKQCICNRTCQHSSGPKDCYSGCTVSFSQYICRQSPDTVRLTSICVTTGRASMSSQWVDKPYSLISTDPFSKDVRMSFLCWDFASLNVFS